MDGIITDSLNPAYCMVVLLEVGTLTGYGMESWTVSHPQLEMMGAGYSQVLYYMIN